MIKIVSPCKECLVRMYRVGSMSPERQDNKTHGPQVNHVLGKLLVWALVLYLERSCTLVLGMSKIGSTILGSPSKDRTKSLGQRSMKLMKTKFGLMRLISLIIITISHAHQNVLYNLNLSTFRMFYIFVRLLSILLFEDFLNTYNIFWSNLLPFIPNNFP